MKIHLALAASCLCGLFTTHTLAQIVVGQTAGFTGATASAVKESTEGAKLYLDAVNAKGGVNGQQIELVSMDDQFDPKIAAANARKLIVDKRAVALFLTRGTPHNELIIPVLDELKVPLVGPATGAMLLHEPVKRHVFNVRPAYRREAENAISLLAAIGVTAIGVLHVDDTFGADALVGIKAGFAAKKLEPIFLMKYDRSKPDFAPLTLQVRASQPQAVLVVGSGTHVVEAVKAIRAAGSRAQVATLSNNASSGFVKALGEHARGTIVTQVFPNERSINSPLVREVLALAKTRGHPDVSPATIEGFAAAKVLVEGLRRAGPNPSGEKVRAGLEAIRGFDLGGMDVTYSATDHTGLDFVDLSIINQFGKFTR